jgi:hypothetical protein
MFSWLIQPVYEPQRHRGTENRRRRRKTKKREKEKRNGK